MPPSLNWQTLFSKHVAAVALGEDGLHVRYNDGAHWVYPDAGQEMLSALTGMESAGRVANKILKPRYGATAYKVE